MGDYGDAFNRNNQNAAVQARTKAQNRANVLQLKLIGQSHPTGLTPNLLKLFEPRPPLEYKPPPEKRKCPPYTGMAQFVSHFAEPTDPEYAPPVPEVETPAQKKARIHQLKLEKGAKKAAEELEKYDPQNDPNASGDPYKTLFVARLSYETTESRLKREFETYGPIKRWWWISHEELYGLKVKMIYDQESKKPRGYAFIEYAHTRDMKAAYKQGDGRKIDGRRVLVDVERGRTVPNWRPRRLGGGLGTTRAGGEDAGQKSSGRETQSGAPSRSQEPRPRDDREREKSRERDREKERECEKSRERGLSHDRPRDREHREDRHHRDRERTRDKERDRDRSGRDRDREHRDRDRPRDRERGRDRRDHERERDRDRPRDREREREKDYEMDEAEHGRHRGHSYERDYDYDHVDSKYDRQRHGERDRGYDHGGPDDGWYDEPEHGHKHPDIEPEGKQYDHYGHQRGGDYDDNVDGGGDHSRYSHAADEMDHYNYERAD